MSNRPLTSRANSRLLLLPLACAVLLGCWSLETPVPMETDVRVDQVNEAAQSLRQHIAVLASDSFGGRFPTGIGGQMTVRYITDAFERIGLQPGNPQGGYTQNVPLLRYRATARLDYAVTDAEVRLESPDDLFPWSVDLRRMPVPQLRIDGAQLVFAGYGIRAPEQDWDDYGDLDAAGKVVLVLAGEPPTWKAESRADEEKAVPGDPVTHGSSLVKAALAAEHGAEAIVVVIDSVMNGTSYDVYAQSLARERLALEDVSDAGEEDASGAAAPGHGFLMSGPAARILIGQAGLDASALTRSADSRAFVARELPGRATITVEADARRSTSQNVLGLLEGSHPTLKHQLVLYLAHWDHIGREGATEGGRIFNGAIDNAAGVAQMIEIARAFAARPRAPHRSILLLATTAEEAGLLGSTFYAADPLYPLECTAAALNLDGGFPYGRTHDVVAIGRGNTTLDEVLQDAVRAQGRHVTTDHREVEYFPRSDHYALARLGVPVLFVLPGGDVRGRPAGWGEDMLRHYMEHHYHRSSDTLRADHDLRGMAEDAMLMYDIGLRVSMDAEMPRWKTDAPFPALRDIRISSLRTFHPEGCTAETAIGGR